MLLKNINYKSILLVFFILIIASGCKPYITRIEDTKIFNLKSPIYVYDNIFVYEIVPNQSFPNIVWHIRQEKFSQKNKTKQLEYGIVPIGYTQIVPKDNALPKKLESNKIYNVVIRTYHRGHTVVLRNLSKDDVLVKE